MSNEQGDANGRERTESGQYAPGSTTTATESDVLDAVRRGGHVVTAREIATATGASQQTALRRLRSLHDAGEIERKEVGARAVVWWIDE